MPSTKTVPAAVREFMSQNGKKGGKTRVARMTREEIRQAAIRASAARQAKRHKLSS